jgi:hypothetical protein
MRMTNQWEVHQAFSLAFHPHGERVSPLRDFFVLPPGHARQVKGGFLKKADKRAVQGAAEHVRRRPWKANVRRIRSSHCQHMDIGEHVSPLLGP